MFRYERIYAGLAVGVLTGVLEYRHLTLKLSNAVWCDECNGYAVSLHAKEMLVSGLLATLAMLATTKVMSILDKKRRK